MSLCPGEVNYLLAFQGETLDVAQTYHDSKPALTLLKNMSLVNSHLGQHLSRLFM